MAYNLDHFIPKEVVVALMVEALSATLTAKNFVTPFTASGKGQGESFKIPQIIAPTIRPYTGAPITLETATDNGQVITIDEAVYFDTAVNQVDDYQSAVAVLAQLAQAGAVGIADHIDKWTYDMLATQAGITGATYAELGTTTTPVVLTSANVLEWFGEVAQIMSDAKVPTQDRRMAIPPFVNKLLTLANIKDTATTDERARMDGLVLKHQGLYLFETPNLKKETDYNTGVHCVASRPSYATIASNYSNLTFFEPHDNFTSAVKALQVWGGKVIQSAGVVASVVSEG